jgi:hypothetical protein
MRKLTLFLRRKEEAGKQQRQLDHVGCSWNAEFGYDLFK